MGSVLRAIGVAVFLATIATPIAAQPVPADASRGAAPKSLASGLYLTGYSTTFATGYTSVTITVPAINNDSSTRTSGTLRLEYWATTTPPAARGETFASGYRLARFPSLDPLKPGTSYTNLVQTSAMQVPPDGTYWFVVLLEEYDPDNCGEADGFCVTDSLTGTQRTFGTSAPPANYSDIWWNPLESGWGLTIVDHQTQMFGVWYTYRDDGSPTWFVIPGGTLSSDHRMFSGDLYQTSGPPYTDTFDPTQVQVTKVGTASIDFAPPALSAGTALFSYSIGSVSGSKQIQRQPFGNAPAAWGSDLTDIYWDPAQSGWGLTISQHGNNLFAVWYTYDTSRRPIFVVMPGATFNADGSFTGDIYTTTGPYYASSVFDPAQVQVTKVGSANMVFDPVASASAAKGPACSRGFMSCKSGKYNPCVHGACFSKWISPQPFGYSAPDTPTPSCEILYNEWSPCVGGMQSRTERIRDPQGCTGATPELTRTCEMPSNPASCSYTYGAPYGACINGQRTHTVLGSSPSGCVGSPVLTEACTSSTTCTSVIYSDWSACQPNNTQTRVVISVSPPGCTYTPVTVQQCTYNGGGTGLTAFDGTYVGSATVTVTVFGPYGSTQTTTTPITVVITNGVVFVNGAQSGTIAATGSVAWTGGTVGDCHYSGTMTSSGGSGSVHCGDGVTYLADGTWTLTRSN